MSKKKTKEEFIKDAREEHGDKYDYSKVEYVNNKTKVCIICPEPEHGEFWQRPSNHLKGIGCQKCGVENRSKKRTSTKEDFIKKARSKHSNKYDYSKVKYVNCMSNVCIICPEHGEFWQRPSNHLRGQGCPKCNGTCVLNKENFIKKAHEKHGDKYDYSKVDYVNNHTKVCISCSKPGHGEFWQKPNGHLGGKGCPKCKGDKLRESKTSTKEKFIEKSRKAHGDKYDYSNVDYVNSYTKVRIICPKHGEFWQKPADHTISVGCPKCNLSHLERSVMNYLDEHEITYDYQKRFKWLGKQSLDFYLPNYNVGIECQGRQHFEAVDYFGGNETFKQTLERDKRKKALCEKHGIKLLYFGNVPNYDTFLGEVVHDDVQYLIDYLEEHKKENT